jgi:mannobiose 2-epimerase
MHVDEWKQALQEELEANILPFWLTHSKDVKHGGFIGQINQNMTIVHDANKSLVLTARILWTFSAVYRLTDKEDYLDMAHYAYSSLFELFADEQYGGFYWLIDYKGNPIEPKKQVYGQAFVIYALTEYFLATGCEIALVNGIALFHLLEQHSYDAEHSGYFEAFSREWNATDNLSLSDKDLNEKKSMNTHLHVLEAYTHLYRVWKSPLLAHKLTELLEITLHHIINQDNHHFLLFFDEQWNSRSKAISYGHDIEGSWLLYEAAQVLGNEKLLAKVKGIVISMAKATLYDGIDHDGGIWNEGDETGITNANKDWWPQAEAMVGFFNAFQLTDDPHFYEAALHSWHFIQNYIVDKVHGEWVWGVDVSGKPLPNEPKLSAWKCPYHNSRACIEMLHRLSISHKSI